MGIGKANMAQAYGHGHFPTITLHPMIRFLLLLPVFLLANCAGVPGESPEHMRQRMERQENWADRYDEKRRIRSQTADERYNRSWDRAMGRDSSSW